MSHGWTSYIAYGRWARPSASTLIRVGNRLSVYLHVALTRLLDLHGFGSRRATRALVKQVQRLRPDVIHLHNLHGYYLHVGILFRYLAAAGIPVVWTLHDCWAFTGHCAHFVYVGCSKWTSGCNRCPEKAQYPKSVLTDRSAKSYRQKQALFTGVNNMALVPVSCWLGGMVEQSFLRRYPVQVIRNGVDTDAFSPQPEAAQRIALKKYGVEGKFVVLGVASPWSDRKGLRDFFALNVMLDRSRYRIVLVGVSKRQLAGLPEGVVGVERTESVRELAELYSAAGVLLNPTWEDTFPSVNMEALACGTPVITYRTGGSPESISEDTGFVVAQGDVEGLYRAVQVVQAQGKARYAKQCRERALALFNKNVQYSAYMELYKIILIKNR
jgi:glycosyltransferase involved in cell wall biosynthesis